MTVVLLIIIGVETIGLVLLVIKIYKLMRHYKDKIGKIYRSFNTGLRQLKGTEDLFNER